VNLPKIKMRTRSNFEHGEVFIDFTMMFLARPAGYYAVGSNFWRTGVFRVIREL